MRPKKQINPGAHRSGAARGKGRYYTTGLPTADDVAPQPLPAEEPVEATPNRVAEKYVGRASVGPYDRDDSTEVVVDLDAAAEWVDPLDQDEFDLTSVDIDLRETIKTDVPDTYYQRFGSQVPGRE